MAIISNCVSAEPQNQTNLLAANFSKALDSNDLSPIDRFYSRVNNLMVLSVQLRTLENHDVLLNYVLVAIVSATEEFFRELICRILDVCPSSRKKILDESVKFGSIYYSAKDFNLFGTIIENTSFADSSTIASTLTTITGFSPPKGTSDEFKVVLNNFEFVCELRHAAVHSCSRLSGKNALNLRMIQSNLKSDKSFDVAVTSENLNDIRLACQNIVVLYNKSLFQHICCKFASEWRREIGDFNENQFFKKIWAIFFSQNDSDLAAIPEKLSETDALGKLKERRTSVP